MISTGLHIPAATLTKLAKMVAEVQRQTATMTLAELRKAPRERYAPTISHFVRTDFTATGAVEAFVAKRLVRPDHTQSKNGFIADIPIIEDARYGAERIVGECGRYLLDREIERRTRNDLREFVCLTADELSAAWDELAPLRSIFGTSSWRCGCLSERLRLRLLEQEIKLRETEANHQRLVAIAANSEFLAQCRKALETETERALFRREQIDQSRYGSFYVSSDFQARSHLDQSVIEYRNWKGWRA
ncbi:hypothetical protein [Limimaricola cinnabarinus]|uniref:hypothetical protein n=1 Tax=Limimaricola cinnabarinus TaxID=1125964 RepID=UPI0005ECF15A|nr:hypothetical protein [Limimaricola cinnabarinus]